MKNILSMLLVFTSLTSTIFSQSPTITFNAKINCDMPSDETLCVYLLEREGMEQKVFPLIKKSDGTWETTLQFDDGWLSVGVTYQYKYCRNYVYYGADEIVDNDEAAYRTFTMDNNNTVTVDTIWEWKWWPSDGQIPDIDTSQYIYNPPDNLPDSTFHCGIELPDYWDHNFIYSVPQTLDRIVSVAKAKYIEYNPVPEITQFYPTPIIDKEGINGTSDADLISIITEIKKRGLKIYLDPFPWTFLPDSSASYHPDEWWIAYEKQWRPIILDYAQISQDYGIDVLTFGMWPNRWSLSNEEAPIVDSLAQKLLNDVKQIYTGKIAIEFTPWGPDLNLYNQGDYLKFNIAAYWPVHLGSSKNPTLDEILTNLNSVLDELYINGAEKWNKPILLSQIAAASYDGMVLNQPDWQTQLYYYPNDPNVPIDLQEQADVYEAYLQAFTTRDWIAGVYSFNYNYWNSLDKAPSIRSKPAEQVVAKWYKWISPEDITNIKDDITLPNDFKLFQNYPNPFGKAIPSGNPSTTIKYSITNPYISSQEGKELSNRNVLVTLKVYNVLGQEVATLVNEQQSTGNYEVKFDAGNLGSGIYFYKLAVGNFNDTKKMMLLK